MIAISFAQSSLYCLDIVRTHEVYCFSFGSELATLLHFAAPVDKKSCLFILEMKRFTFAYVVRGARGVDLRCGQVFHLQLYDKNHLQVTTCKQAQSFDTLGTNYYIKISILTITCTYLLSFFDVFFILNSH